MGTTAPRAPLDQKAITATSSQYWRVSVLDVTASTQDDLIEKVSNNLARSGDVIIANHQSAGRGRLDRKFLAPPSTALLFSLYLTPNIEMRRKEEWSFLPLLVGYSFAHTLKKLAADVSLKWPNDFMIDAKKVGGMISTLQPDGVVIGVGINISMSSQELPVANATSLALEGVAKLDRNLLLPILLNALEKDFHEWETGRDFVDEYSQHSSTLGSQVRIEISGRADVEGMATAIDKSGQLHLDSGLVVSVGDVLHLR